MITTGNQVRAIQIMIPAVPVAQPRARAVAFNGHARVHGAPANHPVNAFKATVRMAWQEAYRGSPLEGPLRVDVLFVFPRKKFPKRMGTARMWKSSKPDRDNCDKAVLDALTGTAWVDDAQVCDGRIGKCYAAVDEAPHVELQVLVLDAQECE